MRIISIVTGAGTILLATLVSIRLFPKMPGFIPAALVAANPYLIYFSTVARAYAAFTFSALLMWFIFLRWRENPSRGNSIGLALTCLLVIMIHLNGIFLILWLLVVILLEILQGLRNSEKQKFLWSGIKHLTIPLGLCLGTAGLFYFQLLDDLNRYRSRWTQHEFTSPEYIPDIFIEYFGNRVMAGLFLALLLLGVFQVFRKDRLKFLWVLLWMLVPLLSTSALGYSFFSRVYARFFIFTLPFILILCAVGIYEVVSLLRGRIQHIALLLILVGVMIGWIPEVAHEFKHSRLHPYHKAAKYISKQWYEGDKVVGIGGPINHHLRPYLKDKEPGVDQKYRKSMMASYLMYLMKDTEAGRVFLVSTLKVHPTFGFETAVFGKIKVSILPPETLNDRYERLVNGFEHAAKTIPDREAQPDYLCIYQTLCYLAKFGDNQKMATHYKTLLENYSKSRRKIKFMLRES